ncbi:DUF4262 domain-containing protein [Hymenobacter sp. GOD-10R]|uniref:DUF4262 domain-containing protein n=1 Tax=Hymenobacter sp. GOD-10R TaxID=3093922 RepID=UPI002D78018E|nr:DUF4262 domain-containing protein [Hymenobacter sp. GOD-10R]WRQ29069.1 DUF4262 domain-containing protein [Hymenobacter sp. GOD-10R]
MSHEEPTLRPEDRIKSDVDKYGWHIALFEADTATPAFAYTIGLWKNFQHPEVITFGLPLPAMHALLSGAAELVKGNQPLALATDNFDFLDGLPVQFRRVEEENLGDYLGYARWYYNFEQFPAIQLLWPDEQSKYPWDAEHDERYKFSQPLLEHKLDFKFFEERNTAVFVAQQVFKENKPILRVRHDEEDGAWQFLTDAPATTDTIMLVALEQVVKHDPTINALFDLPTGQSAFREFVGGDWKRVEVTKREG